jgi:hypothetical protein
MLSSIHPLGERARHNRWSVTVGAFALAATGGGAALGALCGALGLALRPLPGRVVAALALMGSAVALAADLRLRGLRLPHWRRQVDEDWLDTYRGWVYGAGFGAQLGVGFATVITTGAVHLTFLLALLTRSPLAGAAVGAAFGLGRGLSLLAGRRARAPDSLRRLHVRLDGRRRVAGRVTAATLAAVGLGAVVVLSTGAGA